MGSAAILRAIHRYEIKPDAIILESPFSRLLETTRNRFRLMGLPPFPAAEVMIFWGSVQLGINGFRHNPLDDARFVTCPTLILGGGKDERATPEQIQSVFDAIPASKRLAMIPQAGHELSITIAPEIWNQAVNWLLQEKIMQRREK